MSMDGKAVEINWSRKSCNTCARGAVHNLGKKMQDCSVSRECDRKFSRHTPHKNYSPSLSSILNNK